MHTAVSLNLHILALIASAPQLCIKWATLEVRAPQLRKSKRLEYSFLFDARGTDAAVCCIHCVVPCFNVPIRALIAASAATCCSLARSRTLKDLPQMWEYLRVLSRMRRPQCGHCTRYSSAARQGGGCTSSVSLAVSAVVPAIDTSISLRHTEIKLVAHAFSEPRLQ